MENADAGRDGDGQRRKLKEVLNQRRVKRRVEVGMAIVKGGERGVGDDRQQKAQTKGVK